MLTSRLHFIFVLLTVVRTSELYCHPDPCQSIFAKLNLDAPIHQHLRDLPPLILRYDSMQAEMQALRKEIAELDEYFKSMAVQEEALYTSPHPIQVAAGAAELFEKLAESAAKKFEHYDGSEQSRRVLEGYRMLLRRAQRLQERAIRMIENPREHEEEKQAFAGNRQQESNVAGKRKAKDAPESKSQGGKPKEQGNKSNHSQLKTENESQPSAPGSKPKEDQNISPQGEGGADSAGSPGSGSKGSPSELDQGEPSSGDSSSNGNGHAASGKAGPPKPSQASPEKNDSPKKGSGQGSGDGKSSRPLEPIPELDSWAQQRVVQAQMDMLWEKAIRQYGSREDLNQALAAYQQLCEKELEKNPNYEFLKRYAARAIELRERLDLNHVHYSSLEDLSLTMVGSNPKALLPYLRYLDTVLFELKLGRALTSEEERLHQRVSENIQRLESKDNDLSERERGEAFLSQLLGPLSRNSVKNQYGSSSGNQDYNWYALSSAIQNGKLDDLAIQGRLRPFLDVFEKRISKPSHKDDYKGAKVPINEAEPDLDLAQELDRMPYFYRDGAPPKHDVLRLLSGDMLENTFPDKVRVPNPKKPIPKKVSVLLYDTSGSTKGQVGELRDALLQGYLDRSQVEVQRKTAVHTVYKIPFDTTPKAAQRIAGFSEAEREFDSVRKHPNSGYGGTSITAALVATYERIAEHQHSGGELDRANILLITDGQDTLDLAKIQEARRKIDPGVEIVVNIICLGNPNVELERLVQKEGDGKYGKLSFQLIPTERIAELLDPEARWDQINRSAKGTKVASDTSGFRSSHVNQVRESINQLASKKRLSDKRGALGSSPIEGQLSQGSTEMTHFQINETVTKFLQAMNTPIAKGWNKSDRVQMLEKFIEAVAREYKLEARLLPQVFSYDLRNKLDRWLKGEK